MNLAEKMRPTSLDLVIGNEHIVRALRKQFDTDTVSQTILFTGASGTGKTTYARIIGSMLEAELFEIDCGSDSGIDNIRDLIDSVSLSSLFGKAKVFVLDEAHALSKPSQSALLKTLEDPQKNVYFILLTTEPAKLLPTIRTRCVEYKTMEATVEEIGEAVKRVEAQYNVKFEERKDLWSLVEQSNGSLRQVYSLLEKLIAVSDEEGFISSEVFHAILGAPMDKVSENLPKAILGGNLGESMSIISSLKKEQLNVTGTIIGVYNYLKVVYLKNLPSKDKKLMMHDLANLVSVKSSVWEDLESVLWKHL